MRAIRERTRTLGVALTGLLVAVVPVWGQGQNAVVTGRVTSEQGQPLYGANVFITDLQISVGTNEAGVYTITVPAARARGQNVLVRARSVGFQPQSQPITLNVGTQTVDFSLKVDINRLGEVVVTGVATATEQIKLPFTVARVDTSQMPVTGANPLQQLQGKIPGAAIVSAGRPGSSPAVVLRGPVSINASGRSQQPLFILDGVILNGALPDINPADIESVEVVKGAAAASLYGARAGSGVINIRTKTGRNSPEGLRFSVRTEVGAGDIERTWPIAERHFIAMDPTGRYLCSTETVGGSPCARYIDIEDERRRINDQPEDFSLPPQNFRYDAGIARVAPYDQLTGLFQVNQWAKTYDPVGQVVSPSAFANTNVDMRGRVGTTSVYASVSNLTQQGAVKFLNGFSRNSGRVNVDHSFTDRLNATLTTYYSQSEEDAAHLDQTTGLLWFGLTRTPAYVNMLERDRLGRLFIRSNPLNQGDQNANPMYHVENNRRTDKNTRFVGGTNLRFDPFTWLNLEGQFGYDRATSNFTQMRDRGYRTTNPAPATASGFLGEGSVDDETFNSSVSASARYSPLVDLQTTVSGRFIYGGQNLSNLNYSGTGLVVPGLETGDAITTDKAVGSEKITTREIGFFGGLDLDYKERYIVSGLIRRDGTSLFGSGNRWATFGRVAGAWIASLEPWWIGGNALSLFKLRASVGTTGQRPRFSAQYETFTIGTGGTLNPATLGNRNIKPEVAKEVEVGADLEFFSRVGLNVTYAHSTIDDQILPVRPPTSTGFQTQWRNAGELQNKTWEATLTVPIIQQRDLSWTSRLIYDQTRSWVTRLDVPPFTSSVTVGNTYTIFQFREGERIGTFYGTDFVRSCDQLPSAFRSQCGSATSAFRANDQGYIVWVGEGNQMTDGITRNLWRSRLDAANAPWNTAANWGMPIVRRDSLNTPLFAPLGNGMPDFRLGLSQNVTYKRFTLYALVDAAIGQEVWNIGYHWSLGDFMTTDQVQSGKSVETAKPIGYWWRRGPGTAGSSGVGGFYDVLGPNRFSVEDGSYTKLREVSVGYHVGELGGVGDWSIGLIGRNLYTWTDFRGFDPEVGITGQQLNSAALTAVAGYRFPNLRTFTFRIGTTF